MKLDTIKVGKIVGAHGIRGEVRVQPRDADPHMLTGFSTFLLDGQLVRPTANHVHKNIVLMKFPGVDDMNAALALRDKVLSIRRSDAQLPEGVYFDDELLGLENPYACPHGRPTIISISKYEMEKKFKRIV